MQSENSGLSSLAPPPAQFAGSSRSARFNRIVLLIAGVIIILLTLAGLGIYHFTGPTATIQGYVNDLYVKFDANDAYSRICPDEQKNISLRQLQTAFDQLKKTGATYDVSGLTYSLADENFFGTAHVRMGGSITVKVNGVTTTFPLTTSGTATTTLRSTGLGWCLTQNSLGSESMRNQPTVTPTLVAVQAWRLLYYTM